MLVYVDPQTGLLSPMRHDCRMTLNSYEKVIDTQANATRLKRASRAAKRLRFFDDRKPGLLGTTPINAELPHEPRPSVCLNRSTGPNDYCVDQHAVRDKDTCTVKKPTPEHNSPAGKASCRTSPGRHCDGILDRMPVSTSARVHDVTSPKRRSADDRITDTKVSCDCQQHVCGKARARNDQRSVDSDQEAGSDYAHCDKGKYKSASGRRHRHKSDSSSSESSSSSQWDCATGEKQLRQSPGCRQSRLRHRHCLPGPDSSEGHRHRPAHRSASSSVSRSRTRDAVKPDKYDGKAGLDTFLAKFEACAEYNKERQGRSSQVCFDWKRRGPASGQRKS